MAITGKCETCNPKTVCRCFSVVDTVPKQCFPCKHCNSKFDMYMEMPNCGDWETGDFVVRIGCLCDTCINFPDKDDGRTGGFGHFLEVVDAWNKMQTVEGEV